MPIFECIAIEHGYMDGHNWIPDKLVTGVDSVIANDITAAKIAFACSMEQEWGTAFDSKTMEVLARPFC